MQATVTGPDGQPRCGWCGIAEEFFGYHDTEWGFPVDDDTRLFEKLCLESFQSGLSWRTILNKRDNFRVAFKHFEISKVAKFIDKDVARLLDDPGIVRHRGKIEAVINNAKRAIELQKEAGSLAHYFWQFEPEELAQPEMVSSSAVSEKISKDLKKRGWKFVGPTTVYSFMQAMGLVNDHLPECSIRGAVDSARRAFTRP
ncbi:DNA-3-methyladenine glycosylase I [Halioxenophilus aromaticivorans]|uniref:DNA-3-methyladenine glycosylase I n=1 Tax=Halioxenophilus aromaticivorans TaxID=1306992 RepID=A0AAV3U633_9ALTE